MIFYTVFIYFLINDKLHKTTKVIEDTFVKIVTDMNINTQNNIKFNKPDIVVFDKINRIIRIIEVLITRQEALQRTEVHKSKKYVSLSNYLKMSYKMYVEIISFVLTWDEMVTKFNKDYRKLLDIEDSTMAYIQSISLKKTFELTTSNNLEFKCNNNYMSSEKSIYTFCKDFFKVNFFKEIFFNFLN